MSIELVENDGLISFGTDNEETAELVFSGDLCPITGYEDKFAAGEMDFMQAEMLELLRGADAHITNLEAPLTVRGEPILKGGPNLRARKEVVTGLKAMNVTHACLANNHVNDFGEIGITDTLSALEEATIPALGITKGEKAIAPPYYFSSNNVDFALINTAESEFSRPSAKSLGASFLDGPKLIASIKEARTKADAVIVYVHAGREYTFFPSTWIIDMYRSFIDAGADLVVGHHTHVPQGIERYQNGLICYSLGNFIFDLPGFKNKLGTDFTYFVNCAFSKKGFVNCRIIPARKAEENISMTLFEGESKLRFLEFIENISLPLDSSEQSQAVWDEYLRHDMPHLAKYISEAFASYPQNDSPEHRSYSAALYNLFYLCETHKKVIEGFLKLSFEQRVDSDPAAAAIIGDWEQLIKEI